MTSRKVASRGFNLDYVMWLFMRLSALSLFIAGFAGVTAAFIMSARTQTDISTLIRWTFFPSPSHVLSSDIVNLDGFITPLWLVMQILVAIFGVTHGINGLRIVVEDYISADKWRAIWRVFILFLWLFILAVAIYVVSAL